MEIIANNSMWVTRGFDSFREGTFGNGGYNIYVSRAGVLQRIHQYDFNKNGYFDLAIGYHRVDGDHLAYSAVWWNGPNGFSEERVTKLLTAGPHGMNQVGPGNIMDRSSEEYYTSVSFHLPENQRVLEVSYEADIPLKTWITVELRFAQSYYSMMLHG